MKAVERDADDPLALYREQFDLPEKVIYLDGNSLGALPKTVAAVLSRTIEQEWGVDLIRSWNQHDWINLPTQVGEKLAPVLGAATGQVICTDSTSVNLFKLMAAAIQFQKPRKVVMSQRDNFPTDLYMAQGLQDLAGTGRIEHKTVAADQIVDALDEQVALLHLTQVNFRDGQVHDIKALTRRAHDVGALVLWDLSHSAGVLPLQLDDWEVDLAVGCGYKYLNGGPGAPAYLFVRRDLQAQLHQPLAGWMGHQTPFSFDPNYVPAGGMQRFLAGTPSVLAMKALDTALDIYQGLDVQLIRDKSKRLTQFFVDLTTDIPGIMLASPSDPDVRGSQVSLQHPAAYSVMQALIERGVIGDFREPDLMRFGFAPLYNSFSEVQEAAEQLREIIQTGFYQEPRFQVRQQVT